VIESHARAPRSLIPYSALSPARLERDFGSRRRLFTVALDAGSALVERGRVLRYADYRVPSTGCTCAAPARIRRRPPARRAIIARGKVLRDLGGDSR